MPRTRLLHLKLAAALVLLTAGSTLLAQQISRFSVVPLNIGVYAIQAEVATTPAEREQGLMFRQRLGTNNGMVFLFDSSAQVCMWMKNTLIPLSVAFIDSEGKIVNIEEMQPQTTNSHCSTQPVKYALEMNRNWFLQKHIKPGSTVDGLPH